MLRKALILLGFSPLGGLFLACLGLALSATAQVHPSVPSVLWEVTVSETRFLSPSSPVRPTMTVVGEKKLKQLNASSTADILVASGAAFVQKSLGGGGSPILRGFESNKVVIVVDGVRMNNAIFRGGHLQNVMRIDANALERVEVIYGPTSVLYGSDAMGGTMHFVTKRPEIGKEETNTLIRAGSVAGDLVLHADASYGGKKWAGFSSLSKSDYGNIRQGQRRLHGYDGFGQLLNYVGEYNGRDTVMTNGDPEMQIGTGYQQIDAIQKFLWQSHPRRKQGINLQLSTTGNVSRYDRLSERDGAGVPIYAEWYYGPERRSLISYRSERTRNTWFVDRTAFTLAYQGFDESRNTRKLYSPRLKSQKEHVDVVSLSMDIAKTLGIFHWNYGWDAATNAVLSQAVFSYKDGSQPDAPADTRYPDGGSTMHSAGLFIQNRIFSENKKWSATGGIRWNATALKVLFSDTSVFSVPFSSAEQEHEAVNWNVGVAREFHKRVRLIGSVSTAFRAPNVDDLSRVFESSQERLIVPNTALLPEESMQWEVKANGQSAKGVSWEVGAYRTILTQALGLAPFQWNGQDSIDYNGTRVAVFAMQNIDNAQVQGAFGRIRIPLSPSLECTSQYTLTQGRFQARDGSTDYLDHIPPGYGMSTLRYAKGKWQMEVWMQYAQFKPIEEYRLCSEDNEMYATPDGMPGWTTYNVRWNYTLQKGVDLQLALDNATDVNYRYFASGVSAPGRNFRVTFRTTL